MSQRTLERWLWSWRRELLVVLVLAGAWWWLHKHVGLPGELAGFLVGAVVLALLPLWPLGLARVFARARWERRWDRALRAAGMGRVAILGMERVPAGVQLRVQVGAGETVDHLDRAEDLMTGPLGALRMQVIQEGRGDRAVVTVVQRSPLDDAPTVWPWAERQGPLDFRVPLPFGTGEDGRRIDLDLTGKHMLLGGETGSGKSVGVSMVCAAAALDPSVPMFLLDANEMQLGRWRACAERFVIDDMAEANEVVDYLLGEMVRRNALLAREGLDKMVPELGEPPILFVIDEMADFLLVKEFDNSKLIRLVARARASDIRVVAATQTPTYKIVDTAMRNNFAVRGAGRTRDPAQSNVILGDGAAGAGANAATILPEERGVLFLHQDGSLPVRMKTFYPTPAQVRMIAARAVALRSRVAA